MADNATSPRILSIRDLIDHRNRLTADRHALYRRERGGENVTAELDWIGEQCDEADFLIDHLSVGMPYAEAVECWLVDHDPVFLTES